MEKSVQDIDIISPFMETNFDDSELSALDFYRWIFPEGSFEEKGVFASDYIYNAIAVEVTKRKKKVPLKVWDSSKKTYVEDLKKTREKAVVFRHTITDDLEVIERLQESKNFCLMSPLSYVGKQRSAENARMCYAIVVDLDNIRVRGGYPEGLKNLIEQMELNPGKSMYSIPPASAIVASGTGAHIYYILDEPIPLFQNFAEELQKLKRALTNRIWNNEVVDIKDRRDVQQEGIYQGFRIVGTETKIGTRARAFKIGDKISIETLNKYVAPSEQAILGYVPKRGMNWKKATEMWPEWAEKVQRKDELREEISQYRTKIRKEKNEEKRRKLEEKFNKVRDELAELEDRKVWPVNRNVYEWWKKQIRDGAIYGHRYWCVAMLAVYARKASYLDVDRPTGEINPKTGKEKIKRGKNKNPVTYEELESDAFELIPFMNSRSPDNEFTEDDVLAALEYWNEGWTFYPREYIEYHSAISVPKNEKRKSQKQEWHLEDIRDKKKKMKRRGEPFKNPEGRPSLEDKVIRWKKENPEGTKSQCARDLNISRTTVHKWWGKQKKNNKKKE